jgi:Flp pilus assembly protein TadD
MTHPNANRPSPWRVPFATVAVVALLIAAGFGGFRIYKDQMSLRLAKQAHTFAEKRDLTSAVIAARRAYEINPESVAVLRVIAEVSESLNQPDALMLRQRIAAMRPDSIEDHLACAATALRFGQPLVAEQAIQGIPEAGRHDVRYLTTAGTVAAAQGNYERAEQLYAEAAKLEPENDLHRFNLANAQWAQPDHEKKKAARASLEKLCESKTMHVHALRLLVDIHLADNELQTALAASRRLENDPDAAFSDRITLIDLLHRVNSPEWVNRLQQLQQAAAPSPENVGRVIAWMASNNMASQAIEWSKTLQPSILATKKAGAGLAPCYAMTGDWPGLEELVKSADWEDLEYLRLTFFARALREQGDKPGFVVQWNLAKTAAQQRSKAPAHLARIIATWGWGDEVPELLWWITDHSPDAEWALKYLFQRYSETHDTGALWLVTSRWLKLRPDNDRVKNNFALYSLLLKKDIDRAFVLAHEVYDKDPSNPVFASTYAYALHFRGRSGEALEIMNSLAPDQLADPATAAYYGILLAANGDSKNAAKFLALAKGADLLAEEKELVDRAGQGL